MSEITVKLSGMKDVERFIKRLEDLGSAKRGGFVHDIAQEIRNAIIIATPYGEKMGGMAKRSWGQIEEHSGGLAFGSDKAYIGALTFGSKAGHAPWPSAGPRTVENSGRVFSKQAPEGIVEEANLEHVVGQCVDLIIKELTRGL